MRGDSEMQVETEGQMSIRTMEITSKQSPIDASVFLFQEDLHLLHEQPISPSFEQSDVYPESNISGRVNLTSFEIWAILLPSTAN